MKSLLQKMEVLKVIAFKDENRKGKSESVSFYLNPEKTSSTHENNFSKKRGINTSGRQANYSSSSSDEMKLQLILDDTLSDEYLIQSILSQQKDVEKKVKKFLELCHYMDGDIHEPRFLIVEWGSTRFECRLKSVEVVYTLFDKDGKAIRAELNTVFIADVAASKKLRLENKKSPDITHERIFTESDTLPLLTKEIYGNANLFPIVVAFNGIDHFRNIKPGTKIKFPPLQIT